MNDRKARLATLESFFAVAAENPEVDFSAESEVEKEVEEVEFDPFRQDYTEADKKMDGKGRKWSANPSY